MGEPQLLEIIAAVDRLNSWARSRSFRCGVFSDRLRRRIYELKRAAIERADRELVCEHRRFETLAKCRECDGTGRYTDFAGREWPHCRRCESKGCVRLHFLDMRIGIVDGAALFHWHTPSHTFPLAQDRITGETTCLEWSPNQPGTERTPDEAARDLLLAEAAFPPWRAWVQCAPECECTRHYRFYVGEVADRCAHCGVACAPAPAGEDRFDASGRFVGPHRCGGRAGRVEFTFAVCAECNRTLAADRLFDVPVPPELLAPPHVAAWVSANDALAEMPLRRRVA